MGYKFFCYVLLFSKVIFYKKLRNILPFLDNEQLLQVLYIFIGLKKLIIKKVRIFSDINKDRILSPEECCHNGITAGTRVEDEGLIGCFRIAEEFASIFTHWNRRCDRSFVVCCMRVVDG